MEMLKERITTAGVMLQAGKILLAKRRDGGSIGGLWEFPGGKNRWGETPQETLRREFEEELGLNVLVGQQIYTSTFTNKGTLYNLNAFWVTCSDMSVLDLKFHTQCQWVVPQEALTYDLAPSDAGILQQVVALLV